MFHRIPKETMIGIGAVDLEKHKVAVLVGTTVHELTGSCVAVLKEELLTVYLGSTSVDLGGAKFRLAIRRVLSKAKASKVDTLLDGTIEDESIAKDTEITILPGAILVAKE